MPRQQNTLPLQTSKARLHEDSLSEQAEEWNKTPSTQWAQLTMRPDTWCTHTFTGRRRSLVKTCSRKAHSQKQNATLYCITCQHSRHLRAAATSPPPLGNTPQTQIPPLGAPSQTPHRDHKRHTPREKHRHTTPHYKRGNFPVPSFKHGVTAVETAQHRCSANATS